MSQPKNIADLVKDAIDKGATTVEDIHKQIAALPLKVLEEVKFLKEPAREVRRIQERSIGAVYDLIRNINRQAGELASDMLGGPKAAARKAPRPTHAKP